MKRKVLASVLAGVLAVGVLTGCGSSKTKENAAPTETTEETAEDATAADDTADAAEDSTAATESKGTISVAASATPHAEILAAG